MPGIVQLGSKGSDALLAQTCLKIAGFYKYNLDGWFGPESVKALKLFQRATGHTDDGICGPKTWTDLIEYQPSPVKVGPVQAAFQKTLARTIKILSDAVNAMKGRGYEKYNNDVKVLKQETDSLKGNCVDMSQAVGQLALEMGYYVRYIHVKCRVSKTGHVFLKVKGHEFNDWTVIDPAAMLSQESMYPIGKAWCQDGILVAENEPWIVQDDGIT